MKIDRGEWLKTIGYAGAALALAGALRYVLQGLLTPLNLGLVIGGGALLMVALAFNFGAIRAFLTRRSARLGANTIVLSVAVLAILVAVNVLTFRHDRRFDFTTDQLYTLSDQSQRIARSVDHDVRFIFFSSRPDPQLQQLLEQYAAVNHRIHFERVDPETRPELARQFQVRRDGELVATAQGRTVHLEANDEASLTNALLQLTHETRETVCFTEGHGEHDVDSPDGDGYSSVRQELERETYQVKSVNLVTAGSVPADCSVLVIAGPRKPLFPQEEAMVGKYLDGGGKVFVLTDPQTDSGLKPIFQAWNIRVGDDIVIDASGLGRLFGAGPAVPLVVDYGTHPITDHFDHTMTFFPLARTVSQADRSRFEPEVTELLKTSPASFATPKIVGSTVSFNPARDRRGPLSLGVAAQRKVGDRDARLVVIGNSTFATNRWVGLQRNGDLFFNAVNWLSHEENLISIRPKNPANRRLTMTAGQQRVLALVSIILLPGLVVVGGIWIWWRRR
jgi:ABC-type uncharacterized transport system involved in gliding motility auxiliary subunit